MSREISKLLCCITTSGVWDDITSPFFHKFPIKTRGILASTVLSSGDDGGAVDSENSFAKQSWSNLSANKYRLCSCFVLFIAGGLLFPSLGG